MDRQAILDHKRQRLLELRQRRAEIAAIDVSKVNAAIASPTSKDAAVQVDLVPIVQTNVSVESTTRIEPKKALQFEKAIQTDEIDGFLEGKPLLDHELAALKVYSVKDNVEASEIKNDTIDQENVVPGPEHTLEKAMNQSLTAWGLEVPFSSLRLGIQQEDRGLALAGQPVTLKSQLRDFLVRPIVQVAPNPKFNELLVVVYGKSTPPKRNRAHKATLLAGLAVVYNTLTPALIPEFFLQCTSAISLVVFDKSNPAKVFAGLENGSVVMWDLSSAKPTEIAILPTLKTTPIHLDETEYPNLTVMRHTKPILYIGQPMWESSQDPTIVTMCSGGIVNMWSPNLLALPKYSSVKIGTPSTRINELLFISSYIMSSQKFYAREKQAIQEAPEYRFLDLMVFGTKRGVVQRLKNERNSQYLGEKLLLPSKNGVMYDSGVLFFSRITQVKPPLLVSFHIDWAFRLWNETTGKLVHKVPTSTAIRGASMRPGHSCQFVTHGIMNPPKIGFCLEFWDLEVRLAKPIYTIPTREAMSGTASFSADGCKLYVAYDDGSVDVLEIEEDIVQQISQESIKGGLGRGLGSIVLFEQTSIEI